MIFWPFYCDCHTSWRLISSVFRLFRIPLSFTTQRSCHRLSCSSFREWPTFFIPSLFEELHTQPEDGSVAGGDCSGHFADVCKDWLYEQLRTVEGELTKTGNSCSVSYGFFMWTENKHPWSRKSSTFSGNSILTIIFSFGFSLVLDENFWHSSFLTSSWCLDGFWVAIFPVFQFFAVEIGFSEQAFSVTPFCSGSLPSRDRRSL